MLIVRAPTKRLSIRFSSRSSRFIGDPTVVPRRKYYSVGLYTVSRRSASPRSQMCDTPDANMGRNTPSRADTYTSPTLTTSLSPQTLSPAFSSRSSPCFLPPHLALSQTISSFYQSGGRAAADVGVQIPARDRAPHAALPRRAARAAPRVSSGRARVRRRARRGTYRI